MEMQPTSAIKEEEVTWDSVIQDLDSKFETASSTNAFTIDAIRRGDEATIRSASYILKGLQSLAPKRAAIALGKPKILEILLQGDDLVDESVVELACERKDRDSMCILLSHGWPINRPLRLGMSVLDTVVDDLEFTRFLVNMGADVNARSKLDEPALSAALVRGNMDVIRFLMAQGTDLAHGNLLHCAAQRDNHFEGADLVDELVDKGADVNAYRFHNPIAFQWRGLFKLPTPLHVACDNGNIPVAEALLRHGGDPNMFMLEAGKLTKPTPLDNAVDRNDRVLIDLLTRKLPPLA